MSSPIRVLLVDDHPIVREGLRTVLGDEPRFEVVGEAESAGEAVRLTAKLRPDVILMDIVMPGGDGITATRLIKQSGGDARIVVLTSFADRAKVREAIQAGAIGYLMKDVRKPDLFRAIQAAAEDRPTLDSNAQQHLMRQLVEPAESSPFDFLTRRERDVLALIADGLSNKEIGARLGLTENTVKGYVSALLLKIDVKDRTQAALLAVKHGFTADAR